MSLSGSFMVSPLFRVDIVTLREVTLYYIDISGLSDFLLDAGCWIGSDS